MSKSNQYMTSKLVATERKEPLVVTKALRDMRKGDIFLKDGAPHRVLELVGHVENNTPNIESLPIVNLVTGRAWALKEDSVFQMLFNIRMQFDATVSSVVDKSGGASS